MEREDAMDRQQRSQQGSALIMATMWSLLICGFIGITIYLSYCYANSQKKDMVRNRGEYAATEAVERYRVELYRLFRDSEASPQEWIDYVRNMFDREIPVEDNYHFADNPKRYEIPMGIASADREVPGLAPGHRATAKVWIAAISDESLPAKWLEIAGEFSEIGIRVTITMCLAFGSPRIYDMAMHTGTVNCTCCHLEIYGDIGTIDDFRPGWGSEGQDGVNSGRGSLVHGNLYATGGPRVDNEGPKYALKQTGDSAFDNYFISGDGLSNLLSEPDSVYDIGRQDDSRAFRINGMKFSGDVHVSAEDIGDRLPDDDDRDGTGDFPTLLPDKAAANAAGHITSAFSIHAVPMGDGDGNRYDPDNFQQDRSMQGISGFFDGHLVLIGTRLQPIKIDGAVVVSGDIVIKGYVKGAGTMYAGRNIYIAGDVIYKNPPSCYWLLPEGQRNEAARDDIANGADELRLTARNTIVIGDWVYRDSTGSKTPLRERQSYEFLTRQFNLERNGYFLNPGNIPGAGLELTVRDGEYFTDNGESVPERQALSVCGDRHYDYLFTPAVINPDGRLFEWLNAQQYRQILGEEKIPYNSWRGSFNGSNNQIKVDLIANGFNEEEVRLIQNAQQGGYDRGSWMFYKDRINKSGFTLRVIYDEAISYPYQVGRIDAFLYAHRRIAGKVSGKNLVVNGGLIAHKIGVLAPGHSRQFWMASRYRKIFGDYRDPDIVQYIDAPCHYYKYNDQYEDGHGGQWGRFTIHYDYRMRCGGQGFDLLEGALVRRLFVKKRCGLSY